MLDVSMMYSEDELWDMVQRWQKEANNIEQSHNRFKEFMKRLEKAKEPYRRKEQELLQRKRRKNKNTILSVEELENIWRGFPKVRQKIEKDIYD